MQPFLQQFHNQSPSRPPGPASAPHQVNGSHMQVNPQMGFINPPFNTNTNNNNHNALMGAPGFVNFPQFNQNAQLGQSNPGFGPQNMMPSPNIPVFPVNGNNMLNVGPQMGHVPGFQNGQFGWQNGMNQLGNLAMFNPSQVAALAQLLGCANQVAQGMNMIPQANAFVGNQQQLGVALPNNLGQQVLPIQGVPSMLSNPSHTQHPTSQGNLGNRQMTQFSNSEQRNNKFLKNTQRGGPDQRFQKSRDKSMHNAKGKHNLSMKHGGKGSISSGLDNSANHSKSGKKRSLAMFYTEKEIRQWRAERKKNYPSKANVEKKLANKQKDDTDAVEEAKLRRQQLKEVLAKQAELGLEVPEIPSQYLSDHEDHGQGSLKKPSRSGQFQNRFNKRGRFDRTNRFGKRREPDGSFPREDRFVKRKGVDRDDSSKPSSSIKEPTLLQKLMSADIRRDKRRVLQALRFMVLNSFFKGWPEKCLDFPEVIVNETAVETETEEIEPKCLLLERGAEGDVEDRDNADDISCEKEDCQEEGEITD